MRGGNGGLGQLSLKEVNDVRIGSIEHCEASKFLKRHIMLGN